MFKQSLEKFASGYMVNDGRGVVLIKDDCSGIKSNMSQNTKASHSSSQGSSAANNTSSSIWGASKSNSKN